jgi:hypothetical protein
MIHEEQEGRKHVSNSSDQDSERLEIHQLT